MRDKEATARIGSIRTKYAQLIPDVLSQITIQDRESKKLTRTEVLLKFSRDLFGKSS